MYKVKDIASVCKAWIVALAQMIVKPIISVTIPIDR
jgi:hypothetical protein